MRVSFTGTRLGMTPSQSETVAEALSDLGATELHHGACVGADEQAGAIAAALGIKVLIYPAFPLGHRGRGATDGPRGRIAVEHFEREKCYPAPLERNRWIVDAGEALVAAPIGAEILRSGTWSTVRYARKLGRPLVVIYP